MCTRDRIIEEPNPLTDANPINKRTCTKIIVEFWKPSKTMQISNVACKQIFMQNYVTETLQVFICGVTSTRYQEINSDNA